jgi:hypothetical protein
VSSVWRGEPPRELFSSATRDEHLLVKTTSKKKKQSPMLASVLMFSPARVCVCVCVADIHFTPKSGRRGLPSLLPLTHPLPSCAGCCVPLPFSSPHTHTPHPCRVGSEAWNAWNAWNAPGFLIGIPASVPLPPLFVYPPLYTRFRLPFSLPPLGLLLV